jgi:hypothetical protein
MTLQKAWAFSEPTYPTYSRSLFPYSSPKMPEVIYIKKQVGLENPTCENLHGYRRKYGLLSCALSAPHLRPRP